VFMGTQSKLIFRCFAAAVLTAAVGTEQADVEFRCGRIAGYTEDTLVLETRPGEHIEFALDEESETPAPLVLGAQVQVEFKDQGPGDRLALYVLPFRAALDDCPLDDCPHEAPPEPSPARGCTAP
jgi:hypothetical protein